MTLEEFIEYIAWSRGITIEEADAWWKSLPVGAEVCSLALGCTKKEEA
jgi:hypothetical protein